MDRNKGCTFSSSTKSGSLPRVRLHLLRKKQSKPARLGPGLLAKNVSHLDQSPHAFDCVRLLQVYSGGSVGGAALLNEGRADVYVNWAGEPGPRLQCLLPVRPLEVGSQLARRSGGHALLLMKPGRRAEPVRIWLYS